MKGVIILLLTSLTLVASAQEDKVTKLFYKALEYSANGDYENAIKTYEKAIELEPHNYTLHLNLGVNYSAIAEYVKAVEQYNLAIIYKQDDYKVFTNRGNANTSLGQFEWAIRDHKKALQLREAEDGGGMDTLYFNLGDCYRQWGKFDSAIIYYEIGLEEAPNSVANRMNIAFTYIEIEEYELAEAHLLDLIKDEPAVSNNYNNLGYVYLQLGDLEKAEKYVLEAKKIEPGNSWIYRNLGLIHKAKGEKKQACNQLDKALKLEFIKYWGSDYIRELLDYCAE